MPQGKSPDPEKEAARRRKISEARKQKMAAQGFLNTAESREKIGSALRGRSWGQAQREKIVATKRGKRPKNFDAMLAKAHAAPKLQGEHNPNWKGDAAGYSAMHAWVRRQWGTPSRCEDCGTESAGRYEWANKSGVYQRMREDWMRLCVSCHRTESFARGERVGPNKGQHTGRVPRSAFQSGVRANPTGEWQPGQVPHNKYLAPRPCAQCEAMFQPREATRRFCSRACYWASMRAVELKET